MPGPDERLNELYNQKIAGFYQQDPFFMGGQGALQAPLQFPRGAERKPGAMLGAALAKGLLGGLSTAFGRSRAQSKAQDYQQGLIEALRSPQPIQALEQDPRYQDFATQLRFSQLANELNRQPPKLGTKTFEDKGVKYVYPTVDGLPDTSQGPLFESPVKSQEINIEAPKPPSMLEGRLDERIGTYDTTLFNSADLLRQLTAFDPKEDYLGALRRFAKARALRSSDEAQFFRDHKQMVFTSLKSFFPGAISDEERTEAEDALGGKAGITVSRLTEIIQKGLRRSAYLANAAILRAKRLGYEVKHPFIPIPQFGPDGQMANFPSELQGYFDEAKTPLQGMSTEDLEQRLKELEGG